MISNFSICHQFKMTSINLNAVGLDIWKMQP